MVLSWSGRARAYFFSVGVAKAAKAGEGGVVSWAANCEPAALSAEAVHGAWSAWGPWACSVACGGGHGSRQRTCTNPAPSVLGRPCAGAASQRGPCNAWPCGQLSPTALRRVRAELPILIQTSINLTIFLGYLIFH